MQEDRLVKYMNDHWLLSENQHGFSYGRSTQTTIFQFTRAIMGCLEGGNLTLGMFLDLSKAYDCLGRK